MTITFFGTYDRNYSRNQILLQGLAALGVPIHEVHTQLEQTKFDNQKHLKILALISRILRKLKFYPTLIRKWNLIQSSDIIFVAYPGHLDVPLAWMVARFLKKPLIFDPLFSLYDVLTTDFRLITSEHWLAKLMKFFEQLIFRLPDIVLADTELQAQHYHDNLKMPFKKMKIVRLGVNENIYTKINKISTSRPFTVIYYGLYNPLHGVEYIVEAARILRNYSDIRFLFIGDGQTYAENFALAQKYKLTNIEFLKLKEAESKSYLSQADVFLGLFADSPTVFRAIPNKVLQGLALGTSVVTGKSPAVESVFEHRKQIYFCPPANGQAIATAIKAIKSDQNLRKRLITEGYRIFKEQFTSVAVAKQLIAVCNELRQTISSG